MIIIPLLFSLALASVIELPIGLITSPSTDSSLTSKLITDLEGLEVNIQNSLSLPFKVVVIWSYIDLLTQTDVTTWRIPKEFLDKDVKVIIDAANDSIYSQFLTYTAIQNNYLHMVVARPIDEINGETPSSNTLFLETCYDSQAYAFLDIIKKFEWSNIGLVYDQSSNNVILANTFKDNYDSTAMNILDEIVIDANDKTSSTDLTTRLESTTRDSGARVILVFTNPVLAAQLLHSADESVMGGSGYAWVLNSDAMIDIAEIAQNSHADVDSTTFGVLKTGAIGFIEEDADYHTEDILATFRAALTLICQGYVKLGFPSVPVASISGSSLWAYMVSNPTTPTLPYRLNFNSEGVKKSYYEIYNMADFHLSNIGYWDQDTRKIMITAGTGEVQWPGFSTSVPDDKVPIIQIGLLYPGHDSNGNAYADGQTIINGFELARKEINEEHLLGDYQINAVLKDTLMSPSLAGVNIKSLEKENILGYIGPLTSTEALSYISAISSTADPKPLVSYGATSANLTSSETYPSFLRTIQPDGLQAVAIAMFIQQQGWKSICVIYTDDDFGNGVYSSFITNVETLEITIINDENKRSISPAVDGVVTDDTKSDIDSALSECVRNQLKVIVYLGSDDVSAEVAKTAYDKELHGSDYAWIGAMWITENLIDIIESNYNDSSSDIYEVINGGIGLGFSPALSTGAGPEFVANYKSNYSVAYTTYAMLAYDTLYLYAYTIQGMISRGEDFNNGKELMDALRSADFTGASGKVKFSEGTNDRSAYGYSVVNGQKGKIVTVKLYDPLNPNMFTDVADTTILWGGGSGSPPSDEWSSNYDCPFAKNMVTISIDGVIIVICIGTFLFFMTLGLSIFSFRKWRQVEIQQITEPVVRSWKDTLVQATILIEFFQFVAIAPTFESLKIVIDAASNIFMVDFMKVANAGKGTYWTMLSVVCSLCYLWFFLVILIMANAEHWLKQVPFCQRTLALLNAAYLPFFGNTMFLPFTTLLLDVYVCDHKAQKHSFVWRDCYMNCWDDKHYPYIAMSALAISCYEPIAVFSRPLWQQAKTGLNLMIKPFFLLFKTCVQILLIAIGKSLQGTSPIAHGVVFSILFIAFTYITFKLRPFNYSRCNLWELTSLIAVSYLAFLATISNAADPANVAWFIVLMIGWAFIGGGAFLIQKKYMPNLLVPPGGAKSKRKVYDALSLRRGNESASVDMDNSELALKPHDPSPAEQSVIEPENDNKVEDEPKPQEGVEEENQNINGENEDPES